jgi:hypothetical protein
MRKNLTALFTGAAVLASGVAFAAGSVTGTIAYNGTPPKVEKLKRKSDPFCAKKEMDDETVLLSKDGKALQNVVVRVKNAPAATTKMTDPVIIDQHDCMYRPRVTAAMEGQKMQIKNSDGTMHNVHSYAGTKTLFNQAQPPKAPDLQKDAPANSDIIKLKCDVHPWMTGYVVMHKHPFFAVTKEDGKFEIKDLPAGKYTIEAWHEKLGTQTSEVTVEEGKAAEAKLAFSDKKS